MKDQDNEWLIGVNGILAGEPGSKWAQICDYRYPINRLLREDDEVLMAGTTQGLWRVPADRSAQWVQLHDETLTEVLCLAHSSEGILAGSPYGVAVSWQDGEGHMRWRTYGRCCGNRLPGVADVCVTECVKGVGDGEGSV